MTDVSYDFSSTIKRLPSCWQELLTTQMQQPYMSKLTKELSARAKQGATIYPPADKVFHAFDALPLKSIKVVILGQDPYHGEGQAHGLSFSVECGVKVPPSLRNIFRELHDDLGIELPPHGCLDSWVDQGVLLLNNVLTVEKGQAGSHRKLGWEQFTDRVIDTINSQCEGVVFILWGGPAQQKAKNVDDSRHCVLQAPHPSPLSSYRGFFGCKHFSMANDYLAGNDKKAVDWNIRD
ncbi:uracil-DNA glycosylase [Sinobacterium caligoides]|uniref:Uracil-DNA glycosylase n=1 Tax=Sinobacterium caligoides TaxID=933926 RepID=A0A3N2DZR5_9GAMM|nr:uracil-DNA glycosylase [Sinobacterium caligoides]ROS04929.1 uracil-DNA glycosylase [Sinobacterium caligoides]